jgi:hypothetical protein
LSGCPLVANEEKNMPSEYQIEFDILAGHQPGTGATLTEDVLKPSGWRSIGASTGGRFTNRTGGPIKAIYIKTNKAGDTFRVTAESAGRLFDTVWLKTDNTEVYFLDGHVPNSTGIPNLGAFWMRVPANTTSEIEDCDQNGVCPFNGQVFSENPADPTGPGWARIKSARTGLSDRWRSLFAACPSDYREIIVYGESADGRHIAFISNGELLLFDDSSKSVSALAVQHTVFSTVNRISFDQGTFVLWSSGRAVRTLSLPKTKVLEIGRSQATKNS